LVRAEFCWHADYENPSTFANKPIMRILQPSANLKAMGSGNARRDGGSTSPACSCRMIFGSKRRARRRGARQSSSTGLVLPGEGRVEFGIRRAPYFYFPEE
jgi:hypothetical protein